MQYSIDFQGNFGRIIKKYGNLKLNKILSSSFLGNVIVFGGDQGKLGFIDVKKRKKLHYKFQVKPCNIHSIQLCWLKETQTQSEEKVFLTVNGNDYDHYLISKPEVFDVTHFILNRVKAKLNGKIDRFSEYSFEKNISLNYQVDE